MGLGMDVMPHATLLEKTPNPLTRDGRQFGLSFGKVPRYYLKDRVWLPGE
jgi:hypothetical protein